MHASVEFPRCFDEFDFWATRHRDHQEFIEQFQALKTIDAALRHLARYGDKGSDDMMMKTIADSIERALHFARIISDLFRSGECFWNENACNMNRNRWENLKRFVNHYRTQKDCSSYELLHQFFSAVVPTEE